ncbi:MAG: DUF3124 domain-containing protein [Deltaproteobacteria bacterium]|nr:DUF3124 domain-containing protein [Deltaproteobacteria bacterium]
MRSKVWLVGLGGLLAVLWCLGPAAAGAEPGHSRGQTLYVCDYSSIYYGDRGRTINLTTTLSVRNTDPERKLTLRSVRYLDSQGKLVREYLAKPLELGPLASQHFLVEESDLSGGVGAKFLVVWEAAEPVSPPLAQAVMIGALANQGISLTCNGLVVRERGR